MPTGHPDCLTNKKFVFSGVLDSLTRGEAEDFVKRHGGKVGRVQGGTEGRSEEHGVQAQLRLSPLNAAAAVAAVLLVRHASPPAYDPQLRSKHPVPARPVSRSPLQVTGSVSSQTNFLVAGQHMGRSKVRGVAANSVVGLRLRHAVCCRPCRPAAGAADPATARSACSPSCLPPLCCSTTKPRSTRP